MTLYRHCSVWIVVTLSQHTWKSWQRNWHCRAVFGDGICRL